LAGEQGAHLELVDRLAQGRELGLGFGLLAGVTGLLGHVPEHLRVVDAAAQILDAADLALCVRQPAGDLLRVRRVVPQVGRGRLALQVGGLTAQLVEVEDRLDTGEGAGELLELGRDVCHVR
jgi:hypothetical protein